MRAAPPRRAHAAVQALHGRNHLAFVGRSAILPVTGHAAGDPGGASASADHVPLTEVIATEQRGRRRRGVLWGLVAVAGLGGVGWGTWALWPKPPAYAERFRVAVAQRGDLVREVSATGRVEPRSSVQVGAQISGRIEEVLVDFDDRVKAGQVLARFDVEALKAQRRQARANVDAAVAAVRRARLDRDETERRRSRAESLYARGFEATERVEAARAEAEIASATYASAKAQLELQRANASVAETNLQYAEIHSPIDGVVIQRNVEPGQTVAAMLQAPVLFVVAEDLASMRVSAAIDEADMGEVVAGQPASFTVDAYPGRKFPARLVQVRSAPTIEQNVVTYEAILEVDNDDLALRPGMTAAVKIRTAEVTGRLLVPNAALRFSPPGDGAALDGSTVWVLDGGDIRAVEVEPGIDDGTSTAVAPGGALAEGDPVVVDLTAAGREAYGVDGGG